MINYKTLSLGLVTATMLATPVMAQGIYLEPGGVGYDYPGYYSDYGYPSSGYVTSGYSVRVVPGPGYYYGNYGNRYYNGYNPGPRVGAFATAPWDDGYYSSGYYPSYGSFGIVERQW
jgi:hypothetical protein